MWYHGGGVGHLGTRNCNKILLADEHTPLEDECARPEDAGEPLVALEEHRSGGEESEGEEDDREEGGDNELILATSDLDIITAAGYAAL